MKQIVIIGSGHNGLCCAFYLAKAGYKPVVLERRSVVGGAAVTEELAPGFRCPTLAHAIGPLRPSIVRDMGLERRVEFIRPDPRVAALAPDGAALVLRRDEARTAEAVRAHSDADAARYPEFCAALERLSRFLLPLLESAPPDIDKPGAADIWELLKTGRRFRALGKADGYRLLRWLPMPAADLVGEWFSNDLLQAVIAARGIVGVAQGPWSAGTGAVMLLNAAFDPAPGGSSITVKGGPGALTRAMADAAREAGVEIRLETPVARVLVHDGRAAGVQLADGTELAADAVVSNADPRRTMLGLVDPMELEPGFVQRMRHYRMPGTSAKINLTLLGLPRFNGIGAEDLAGRIHIGPSIDYLEKAFDSSKYGQISAEPYLDISIPSVLDPTLCPEGRHVMSIYVQYAPYELARGGRWEDMRDQLSAAVLRTLERYSPDIRRLIDHVQIGTPLDLEDTYSLTSGHILHGEPALDQLFAMRPLLGWARYRTPIHRLFLCGAGTHPGGGVTGVPGWNAAREIVRVLKSAPRPAGPARTSPGELPAGA